MSFFIEILKKFNMVSDVREKTGLVFVGDKTENHSEILALEHAARYKADAVYFRRFADGRPPMPQIYIYDCTQEEKKFDDLHKKLWNCARIPLFIIFFKTQVKIFSCLEKPEIDKKTGIVSLPVMEKIEIVSKIKEEIDKIKDFSAEKFDNGSFWVNSKYKDKINIKNSVYKNLISQLKTARNDIIKRDILSRKLAHKLLVMSLLIKYLEERRDEKGGTVFPDGFFSKFSGNPAKDTFTDVLKTKGACLKLLDNLSGPKRFNGKIFEISDKAERKELENADLKEFADFFGGKIKGKQYTFWRLYSFNDMPAELISNVYEALLEEEQGKSGIFYTPPYLVNLIIDEVMPLADYSKKDFKVIDPSCGSGIFLVLAYKRMIQWWRIRNNWKIPGKEDLDELKGILKNNIFGVDIHEEAVRLAFFSLSLALIDELSPKVVWEDLRFDPLLGDRLIEKDFFELLNDGFFKDKFDLVTGNPPFLSKLTDKAKEIEDKCSKNRPKLPDRQISLLFLEQSIINLCKQGARLSLILPAGSFLYNKGADDFRKYFIETFNVTQIIDFTPLKNFLFEKSSSPIIAVFAENKETDKDWLWHLTIRRTKQVKEKIYFEIDPYDFHRVTLMDAVNNKLIWKANLLGGGGRLKRLIRDVVNVRTLGEYLENKKQEQGWKYAEGYILGDENKIERLIKLERKHKEHLFAAEEKELKDLKKKYKKADYLTGKETFDLDSFTEEGIKKVFNLEKKYFYRTSSKNKEIFTAPHLLIKEIVGKSSIPAIYLDYDLSFTNQVTGIYAPKQHKEELKEIEKRIRNNRNYLFFLSVTSGRYIISRATSLLEKDILSLPYPEKEEDIQISRIEQIIIDDILDYILDFYKKGENSKAEKPASDRILSNFAELYCKILNSVYKEFRPCKPIRTDSFIAFPFYYKDKPEIEDLDKKEAEKYLKNIIVNNISGERVRIIRFIRIYQDKVIYIIKPKQTRYWLRSVAVRDADETFSDLVKQGY